jgi:Domain of unknown function (DUF4406)
MRLYILGKMTGVPYFNFPAFDKARDRLNRHVQYQVTSPADLDRRAGFNAMLLPADYDWSQLPPGFSLEDTIKTDIAEVLRAECYAALDDWPDSKGARAEKALCDWRGIPRIDWRTGEVRSIHDIPPPPPERKPTTFLDDGLSGNSDLCPTKGVRQFATGATRNLSADKHDYDGFLSPHAIEVFGAYMHKHRLQANGEVRDSDNWQKGIPMNEYVKSSWRHFLHFWRLHRGYEARDEKGSLVTMEDTIGALMFNVMGYCHEYVKRKTAPDRFDV